MKKYIDKVELDMLHDSINESPSVISNLVFREIWENHAKEFDYTYSTWDKSLLPPTQQWTSSLSDNVCMFPESVLQCKICSVPRNDSEIEKRLHKNKCVCNTIENEQNRTNLTSQVNTASRAESMDAEMEFSSSGNVRNLNTLNDPRTNRIDLDRLRSNNVQIITNISSDAHNQTESAEEETSRINKLQFKIAKEQLMLNNPFSRRTLKTSSNAKRGFVSPMIPLMLSKDQAPAKEGPLKHIDPKMIELIESEIMDKGTNIAWSDIAGLESAKAVIQEAVVWPLLRPDIFTGLRQPPKGILLFGPPGTGKTLIGKCVAAQCNATFFSISASSLTSKWIGDGEKMVRALFAVARNKQPAVIFIDEIDSLLMQRKDTEHEATMRIKTEFLVQFDGAATAESDRVLLIGATNRPQALDEAARRRLVKRLYVPLPELIARKEIIINLIRKEQNCLTEDEILEVAELTHGYSGADMKSLCTEAAMGPIRSVPVAQLASIDLSKVRAMNLSDFKSALEKVKPSVSQDNLCQYVKWNETYGH